MSDQSEDHTKSLLPPGRDRGRNERTITAADVLAGQQRMREAFDRDVRPAVINAQNEIDKWLDAIVHKAGL